MKPDLSGLLEKAGVRREAHQRGEKALVSSIAKPWTPAERAAMQHQVDVFYARFTQRLIAALSAQGTSIIDNIEQIDRGYQNIEGRLQQLGALIERI